MDTEALTKKYEKYAEPGGPLHGLFVVRGVRACNFEPHQFMIGPRYVEHACDHHGGMLGEETVNAVGCYHPTPYGPCGRSAREHTHDTVLFLSLARALGNKEAADALFSIKEEMVKDKIDGVAFVETPEKFKIAPPETPGGEGKEENGQEVGGTPPG